MSKSKNNKTISNLLTESLVSLDDYPYEVPGNWICTNLDSITSLVSDGSHNPPPKKSEGYPMLSGKNILNGSINYNTDRYLNKEDYLREYKRTPVEENDVLLTIVGSIGRTTIVPDKFTPFVLQRSVALIKPLINSRYLTSYFSSPEFQKYLNENAKGTAQKGIYLKTLKNSKVALPPLQEQERIVKRLEFLLGKIEEAKQLIEKAKESFELRRAAILDKAFRGELTGEWRNKNQDIEDGSTLYNRILNSREKKTRKNLESFQEEPRFELPKKWTWVRIGEVMSITSGGTPKRSFKEYYEGAIPWIKTGEIKWNLLDDSEEKITLEAINNSSAKLLPKDSVLVAMYGQGLTRGRAAILNIEATCNQAVCALLPNEYILPEFLFYYFMEGYNRFRKLAQGGNQENFSASLISTFLMPLPPLEEQHEIVHILKKLIEKENEVLKLVSEKENIETLKQSILSKAFRGELGTNDPTEENAIELLKEILQDQIE